MTSFKGSSVTCPSKDIFLSIPLSQHQNAIRSPLTLICLMLLCAFFFGFSPTLSPQIHPLEPQEGALFFKMMEMHVSGDEDKIAISVLRFQIGFIEKICGYITRCFITVVVSPLHAHLLGSFEFVLRSVDHQWSTARIWLKEVWSAWYRFEKFSFQIIMNHNSNYSGRVLNCSLCSFWTLLLQSFLSITYLFSLQQFISSLKVVLMCYLKFSLVSCSQRVFNVSIL